VYLADAACRRKVRSMSGLSSQAAPTALPPFVGERFQAGHTLREDNPAIRLTSAGDAARGIPPCAACHGPGEPEFEASFLGPVILGNFRESFAHYIRNGETLICVQASTDDRVELAVDTLKQYTPIEVKVVPAGEDPTG
jgi:hypothetical protein